MRIFDEQDNLLEAYDEQKGWLREEKRFVCHHEAVAAIGEQGHYETLEEYPNGGKDVAWIVDVPGAEAKEAWDEYEDILRFVSFTPAQLAKNQITQLKQKLFDTDYKILKIVEGAATLAEMAEAIVARTQWRKQINELEDFLKGE